MCYVFHENFFFFFNKENEISQHKKGLGCYQVKLHNQYLLVPTSTHTVLLLNHIDANTVGRLKPTKLRIKFFSTPQYNANSKFNFKG